MCVNDRGDSKIPVNYSRDLMMINFQKKLCIIVSFFLFKYIYIFFHILVLNCRFVELNIQRGIVKYYDHCLVELF